MHTKKKKEVNNASTCSGGCTAPIFTDGAAARSRAPGEPRSALAIRRPPPALVLRLRHRRRRNRGRTHARTPLTKHAGISKHARAHARTRMRTAGPLSDTHEIARDPQRRSAASPRSPRPVAPRRRRGGPPRPRRAASARVVVLSVCPRPPSRDRERVVEHNVRQASFSSSPKVRKRVPLSHKHFLFSFTPRNYTHTHTH